MDAADTSAGQVWIALLRGINVGGRAKIVMDELRAACTDLGWQNVRTYIQSGNVVFSSPGDGAGTDPGADPAADLAANLAAAVEKRFGVTVPVIVRSSSEWRRYVENVPFPTEAENEPSRVLLALSEGPVLPEAAGALQERAAAGERVRLAGDALWLYFPNGVARSKLTPRVLDRLAGSPVTTRNWRTVLKLARMAEETPD